MNPSGEKITGEHKMIFSIYNSSSAKVPVWEEINDVQVKKGEFKVTLGKRTPLPQLGRVRAAC